jgi:hypothetical protein
LVGTTLTGGGGRYVVAGTSQAGRYRAIAKKVTLGTGDICKKAVSPSVNKS